MSEHNLLLESRVLFVGANIAVASLLAGLTGLTLRRCLVRRALPLQHGVLTATLVVLLLAPLCLAITARVPGIGFKWRFDKADTTGPAVGADAPEPDKTVHQMADNGDDGDLPADLPIDAPAVPTWLNDDIPFESTGDDIDWILAGEPPALPPLQEPDPVPVDEPDAIAASLTATAPLAAESEPVVQSGNPATAVTDWSPRSLASILLLAWCAGITVGLARCISGFLLVARLRRKARSPNLPILESLAGSVCADLGLRRPPRILLSDRVDVPLTLGLRRPVILLPADLVENASRPRLRAILLHEAAHVVRRDLWVGVLQRLAAALYWWNPLVHRVNRQLNDVRESLCDNHVLLAGEDVRDYADALLTLAARIARPARAATALGLVGRPSPGLSGRITHLLKQDRDMSTRLTAGSRRIVVVTTLGIICGLSLAAVRAPGQESTTQPDTAATTPAADPFAGNNQAADHFAGNEQAADPFSESDAAPVRLSDVREHVLSMGSLNFLLDLDTDQTMDPPARNRRGQAKMDVHPAQEQPDDRPAGLLCTRSEFLVGSPLRGMQVTPEDWDASVSDLQNALASDEVQPLAEMEYDAKEPATYFFRTSDGTDGILQLTAIIKGSPPFIGRETQGIRLRYKVLVPVAEVSVPSDDGATDPLESPQTVARGPAADQQEEQQSTKLLPPQHPIATSGVVPLLMAPPRPLEVYPQSPELELNSSHAPSPSENPSPEDSVDWKSFIAVRALFGRMDSIVWLVEQTGAPLSSVLRDFRLLDFELQRQTRANAEEAWSDWEQVDIRTAIDVLQQSAGYDPDVVPPGAISAAITMPLPMRGLGDWDIREVSHPLLQDRQPSRDEIARQVAVLRELLKDVLNHRERNRATTESDSAGFSDVVFDTRELIDELADEVELDLDFDQLLFRFLDFDVSPGPEYRYHVRVKFGTDRAHVHWTDWSDPTEPVVVAFGQPATGAPMGLRDPLRRRRNWRELLNRSIVRLVVDVDGDVRIGSGVVIPIRDVARQHGMQSLVTAAHLLEGFDSARHTLEIQLYGESEPRRWEPAYMKIDKETDLALMCLEDPDLNMQGTPFGAWRPLPAIDDVVTFHFWTDNEGPRFREQRVVGVNPSPTPSTLECDGLPENGAAGGGLFNAHGQLIGICIAADPDERRTVFAPTPAILEFLGIDEAPATLNPATVPEPPKEVQVGMTFDEVIAIRGKHYRPTTGMGVGQLFLVYDDVTVGIQGSMRENEAGRVFRIDPTPRDVDSLVGNTPYADAEAHIPQNSGPNPSEAPAQQATPRPGRNGAVEKDVILIALDADDDGELAEVHFLSDSLGAGQAALDQLSRRMGAAAQAATEADRKLQVQISVDPQLKYASVVRVIEICREHDLTDVRVAPQAGGEGFTVSIGFIRDAEGRKLRETPVVFWGDSVHSTRDLAAILEGERRRRPGADVTVIIRADSDVTTSVIQDVIRQAQAAGFDRFALRVLQSAATGRWSVQGVVLEVDEDSQAVTISVGNDDGIRPRDRLYVSRGSEIIARIAVTRVEADRSLARVTQSQKSIAVGDHVLGPIRMEVPGAQTGDASPEAQGPTLHPSRIINDADEDTGPVIQVQFQRPHGMNLHLPGPFPPGTTDIVTAPFRLNVTPGELAFKLANIPDRDGLELRTTIDVAAPNAVTEEFLEHNALSIQFTDEDLSQAESGNYVVKVIYLPHPQEDEADGVGTLVSTHLDPSLDPVKEAERRGTVLAVVRLGNRTEGSED